MAQRGKKYQEAAKLIDPELEYTLEEACDLVKKTSKANFDESVDLDIRLGVDPRHADQMVRGSVSLPHGTGKEVRVLALVNEAKQEEAAEAGADHVGLEDYIDKIEGGWTDVDVIVATPDVMGQIGKLGRILGPRGLMPNPKSGTVTNEGEDAVKEATAGKSDVRVSEYDIDKIEGGWTDVDVIVAAPDVMGQIGKLGRILGPRGLMPNPKSGTVTNEVADAVKEAKAGKIDFRVDDYGILHVSIGKASF